MGTMNNKGVLPQLYDNLDLYFIVMPINRISKGIVLDFEVIFILNKEENTY